MLPFLLPEPTRISVTLAQRGVALLGWLEELAADVEGTSACVGNAEET